MVYIVNTEFCQIGFELSRKRNILFTGITRSRCWIRLFGVGEQMAMLKAEVDQIRMQNFELTFTYPDRDQLKRLSHVHRDMTSEERSSWEKKISTVSDVVRAVMDGDLPLEALPQDVREQLAALSGKGREEAK